MDNILILKNNDKIVISNDGKKFVIDKQHKLFNTLTTLTVEEIKQWWLDRKCGEKENDK